MPLLYIHLQEGFKDNNVIIRIKDEEVYRKEHVTTIEMIGLADSSFRTEVEKGSVNVEAILHAKGIAKTITLNVLIDTYLGISVADHEIEYLVQDKPFGYA